MPLTSAYSHRQSISDEMNIYIHQEVKPIKGNLIAFKDIIHIFLYIFKVINYE